MPGAISTATALDGAPTHSHLPKSGLTVHACGVITPRTYLPALAVLRNNMPHYYDALLRSTVYLELLSMPAGALHQRHTSWFG